MLANIVAGVDKSLELDEKNQYVLIVSSDIPTLKPEMVDWLVDTCMETQDDLYYGVCSRETMEQRFPDSKRTYTKLKDIELCGADINISHVRMATEHLDLWEQLIGNRKSPLKQATLIGLDTFFQVFTRSITLEDLVTKVCNRIGIQGRAIQWPYAEACMDVDKPHQLELLRTDLAKQQRKSVQKAKGTGTAKKTTKTSPKSTTMVARAKPAKSTAKRSSTSKKTPAVASSTKKLKAEK